MTLRRGRLRFECLRCHNKFPRYGRMRYCPKCAAKIVSENRIKSVASRLAHNSHKNTPTIKEKLEKDKYPKYTKLKKICPYLGRYSRTCSNKDNLKINGSKYTHPCTPKACPFRFEDYKFERGEN